MTTYSTSDRYPDLLERTKGVSEPWSGLTTILFNPSFSGREASWAPLGMAIYTCIAWHFIFASLDLFREVLIDIDCQQFDMTCMHN
jgi:hypothetical protein